MPRARRAAAAAATAAALACLLVPGAVSSAAPQPPPRTILVACPVSATTEVKPLSVKSLAPLPAAPRTETTFVAWAYNEAPAPGEEFGCTAGSEVAFAEGETLSVPGSSGATLTRSSSAITITLGGESGTLAIPPGAAVSACQVGPLYIVRAADEKQGNGASVELAVNADTRCLAANSLSINSIPGATSAERTGDPAFAATAGLPLPSGYTPPPPPPPPPAPLAAAVANPCIAPEAGQSVGLSAAFYEAPYAAEGGAKVAAPLDFKGEAALKRCDCPNHKVSNTTWPGTPSLAPTLASNFGAVLSGQFLVSRPAGGVVGEGPDLFPTASDYHLVCLQHDGSASLSVDGAAVYESGLSAEAAAGFKQYCAPVMLIPGWHDVDIKYGNSPRAVGGASSSVLRLFVIDAAQVNSVNIDGVPSYEIVWQGQGRCCTSTAAAAAAATATGPSCLAPLDCCRFRTAGPCADKPAAGGAGLSTPKALPTAAPTTTTPVTTAALITPPPATTAAAVAPEDTPSPTPAAPKVNGVPAPTANLNETVPVPVKGCSPPAAPLPLKATVRSLAPQTDGRTNVTLSLATNVAPLAGFTYALAAKAKAGSAPAVDLTCTPEGPSLAACSGLLALANPYDCLTTPLAIEAAVEAVDKAGKRCPAGAGSVAVDACQQPQCQLYAVDMGYCGSEGLVTDREAATLVLACTDAVAACGDCFSVTGPPGGGRVAAFASAPGSNSSYTLTVAWDDKAYRGPVIVAVEPARAADECELRLSTPACGFDSPAPVDALTFEVKNDVPVKAAAYKILAGCGAGGCPAAASV